MLCNAVTGEMTDYKVEDVPTWVDKVYSAELLIDCMIITEVLSMDLLTVF